MTLARDTPFGAGALLLALGAALAAAWSVRAGAAGVAAIALWAAAAAAFLWWLRYRLARAGPRWLVAGPAVRAPARRREPRRRVAARWAAGAAGAGLAATAFAATGGNRFTLLGGLAWACSIACFWWALDDGSARAGARPHGAALPGPRAPWWRDRRPGHRRFWAGVLLATAIATGYRVARLDAVPAEMTSDHVEKVRDAERLRRGDRDVFMLNNDGREALHFYFLAGLAQLGVAGMGFRLLKLASVVEGVLLVPAVALLGRELLAGPPGAAGGDEGMAAETGVYAALLAAIGWWPVLLSRLGLRLSLAPLVACLLSIALLRALRSGRRRSWLWVGLWLGVGLWSYQSLRLAPAVAVAGAATVVGSAWLRARNVGGAGRRRRAIAAARRTTRRQAGHLLAAAVVAGAIAVPLARVASDHPKEVWSRARTRLTSAERTVEGSAAAVLARNLAGVAGMFHLRGDRSWFTSVPEEPALDPATGALLLFGAVGWGVRLWRRRDPVDLWVPVAIGLFLLPSALALAFPLENPHLGRASGALPLLLTLAAWPLALVRRASAGASAPVRVGAAAGIAALLAGAAWFNAQTYFGRWASSYVAAAPNPGEIARAIEREVPGATAADVWLVNQPFWQDHRALGIELGDVGFDRVVAGSAGLERLLAEGGDRAAGSVFVLRPDDDASLAALARRFPDGTAWSVRSRTAGRDFHLFLAAGGD